MEQQVSYSIANFAAKFCNELGTNKTTICSPLSAEIVLALLALGCKGQSHAELLKALNIPDDEALRSSFAFLTSTLNSVKGATVNVANKVYVKKGGELKPGIKKDAEEVFESSLEQLDFNEKEAAAGVINTWVAQQTNHKIKDIVSPEMLNEDISLVIINAIYFQGCWKIPFNARLTHERPFQLNESTTIAVPMMRITETWFNYGVSQELNARLLQLDYEGGEASMVIVLPDAFEGLNSVLQKLASGHNIMADIENLKLTELDIMIPKFKVETTIDLKDLLSKLGIESIFKQETSDIDMFTSSKKLFVSEAIQKALIVVDEKGTEAAACTMMMGIDCSLHHVERFAANRPFLYLLTARQIPLFVGVYEGSDYALTIVEQY